jgi:hypothetical protein
MGRLEGASRALRHVGGHITLGLPEVGSQTLVVLNAHARLACCAHQWGV